MHAILGYVVKMLRYMVLLAPCYLAARALYLRRRKGKVNWYREAALLFFALFMAALATQTVLPELVVTKDGVRVVMEGEHYTNLVPFRVFFDTWREVFANGKINAFLINFLGNVVMFVPLGFFVPLLYRVSSVRALCLGACFSLFVEIVQLFLPRATDVDDLFLNTIGVLGGVLLYRLFQRLFPHTAAQFHV